MKLVKNKRGIEKPPVRINMVRITKTPLTTLKEVFFDEMGVRTKSWTILNGEL